MGWLTQRVMCSLSQEDHLVRWGDGRTSSVGPMMVMVMVLAIMVVMKMVMLVVITVVTMVVMIVTTSSFMFMLC